jgi:hypothetical protein
MVNTRNSHCNGQPSNNNNNPNNNAHLEQLLTTQTQLMQAMLQTLNCMELNQQHVPPPPPPHQSRLVEFLRTRPTTFSQAKDPMDAEDWLKGVDKKLVIAQCTNCEKVLFAAHQLYVFSQLVGDVLQHPCKHRHHHLERVQGSFPHSLCASWHHEVGKEGIRQPEIGRHDSE